MTLSQGAKANKNGKIFENMMLPIFKEHGFTVLKETEFNKLKEYNTDKYVLTNAKYQTIYGRNGVTEFLILYGNRRIRVEDKYQSQQGSVDEKFPYMYLNGVMAYPEKEIIFVVDGGGFKPESRKWLQERINEKWLNEYNKDIKLMTMIEFVNWFNDEFE